MTEQQDKIDHAIADRVLRAHNLRPLDELIRQSNMPPPDMLIDPDTLASETSDLATRADALIDAASRATATDDDTASKCVTLAKMLGDHGGVIDDRREARKKPFLAASRLVDAHYSPLRDRCRTARARVVDVIDQRRAHLARVADEQRRQLDEAAAKARATAAAAAEQVAQAAAAGRSSIGAEIAAKTAADTAQMLENKALAVSAAPIDSGVGAKAYGRAKPVHEISDALAFFRWMLKTNREAIMAALHDLAKPFVGKVAAIPGVTVTQTTKTVIR